MPLGLILVTYAHYPDKLIESVERSQEHVRWYIHHHGTEPTLTERVEQLASRGNYDVVVHGINRGLSKSWNDGLHQAYEDDCEYAFLLNDDLFFLDNGFDKFVDFLRNQTTPFGLAFLQGLETGGSPFVGKVQQQGFACCALTRAAIDNVGYFDENIVPAYYEDIDYDVRCRRVGLPIICCEEVLVEHERSKTSRSDRSLDVQSFIDKNRRYFNRKWNPNAGTFQTPFGDERFSLKISWQDHENPYPGVVYDGESGMATTNGAQAMPDGHHGPAYFDVMESLSIKRGLQTYLEIGVSTGLLMQHIHCKEAVGVDPSYALNQNIMNNKQRLTLLNMTSDAFFRDEEALKLLRGQIDLAFLDGMHTFEFLLRDFLNTESHCGTHSLIAMHDCLPLNAEMAHRNMAESIRLGQNSRFPNYWTGDVWKIIPILQKYRPDLRLVFVDAPPTGIVFASNLDPSSKTLSQNYFDIIDEFTALPNAAEEIDKMYGKIKIISSAHIIADFDHSVYFRA